MAGSLKLLVIKPTSDCNANCPTCSLRRELFRKNRNGRKPSLERWVGLFAEARQLGCNSVHISGGEPLLYKDFDKLIIEAKKQSIQVNLNTNGALLTPGNVEKLANSGLDSITVSIYSTEAVIHDKARGKRGLLLKALEGIRLLKSKALLLVDCQTILAAYNLRELDKLVQWAFSSEIGNLYVSYIEGDIHHSYTPTAGQIVEFRNETLPKIQALIRQYGPDETKEQAIKTVESIFSDEAKRIEEFSKGDYFPGPLPDCQRPETFSLVLANGDVLPCNGVEYSHEPVMGNILENSFEQLWTSIKWDDYRINRSEWCHKCPLMLHFKIPIKANHV
jgi:radical SAM protein with 4Fe4S-binding SPASM domain